ncbi:MULTISPECIES: helix-turn-helix transcriptional regulator [Azohydromonas]|uniref:Helix-turn-helix transcriptional regulator n=1 Tax=Azohydromonas lata TaxID=45677 RepID=A0ABU5I7P4_9BURK|nr:MULTISPECIES: helix-turn-helix transcriptional regulator [Azohydromonas]MDZ5455125.1 helix-turn-helix transcriptional regulator [Azohydromonas lata]
MQTAELKPLMDRLAPIKVIGAHLAEGAYEVAVQDIHWQQPGSIRVLSKAHCLVELNEPAPCPEDERTRYVVCGVDGAERSTGTLNFMPPDTEVSVRWTAGRRRSVVCVMEPRRLGLLAGIDWCWDAADPTLLIDMHNERVHACMRWLVQEMTAPSFASPLQTSALLTMLAIELHRHCVPGSGVPAAPRGRLSSQQLNLIQETIEACGEPSGPSLSTLADACGLSARELSSVFKKTTGHTLRSYVATVHIARAKVLLGDEALLIKQVAYRSGFRSAAAFSDAFRRATGLTPVQYRQRLGLPPQRDDALAH